MHFLFDFASKVEQPPTILWSLMSKKSSTFAAEFEKAMANKLNVQGVEITLISDMGNDYICLTDMAGAKSDEVRAADVIPEFQSGRI